MSAKDVVAFAHKLEGNDELQAKIKSLTPGDSAGVVTLASGLGFKFTVQELRDVIAQEGELTEEQLDQVAGGIIIVGSKPGTNAILIGLLLPAIQPPGGIIAPTDFHK